ncbi:DUF3152 domain-containing protein, partial [Streptomyces sp. GC420]|uniref:DUF3152 domain-containing protein n=1 Tax=Streptomyces sp. GC420 TaxID=2697568 RepID=UPI001414FA59
PEQWEAGGGWGLPPAGPAVYRTPGGGMPRTAAARIPGPRREYVEAFEAASQAEGVIQEATAVATGTIDATTRRETGTGAGAPQAPRRKGKGRAFTGILAAAVTTVVAVVVTGHMTKDSETDNAPQTSGEFDREAEKQASRSQQRSVREAPSGAPAAPATYTQKMAAKFALAPDLEGSGEFEVVGGHAAAPGEGRRYRYRIDVEKGLGLDTALFAEAVHKTLNDDRSWAHNGAASFERISSGEADFVITLASPGTTAVWCAKSGLDTTVDNVSCDSASTDRIMINAYRWARGAETYGDKMLAYRQMLINHEVGHRLGNGHTTCSADGALAPVMQQQTKFLSHDGITCRPNPWPYPGDQ